MNSTNPFQALFGAYVGANGAGGIGSDLIDCVAEENKDAPLLVVAGTATAAFIPGQAPRYGGLRGANPGFNELAGISHLGPAIGSLVKMCQTGYAAKALDDAQALQQAIAAAQAANTVGFWRGLQVEAWAPNIDAIVALVDYACALSLHYLAGFLHDPAQRTAEAMRSGFLDSRNDPFPVPYNEVMLATFALTGVAGTAQSLKFLQNVRQEQSTDWKKTMVVLTGGNGGPAAGLTRCTNHFVDLLAFVFDGLLEPARIFLIPLATDVQAAGTEAALRKQWATLYSRSRLAGVMFDGYPRFVTAPCPQSDVAHRPAEVHFPPRVKSADDLYALMARLRFMMEDPTQLLSSSVATYVLDQFKAGVPAEDIPIPGLSPFRKPGP